jgi:hypothetical protein
MADLWGDIGSAAGKIYTSSVGSAPANILDVKRKTKLDDALLYMGLGWLAREGKAQVSSDKNGLKVKVSQ